MSTWYKARTLRGLEGIVAAEINVTLPVRHTEVTHREVRFTLDQPDERLYDLGTADDLFVCAGSVEAIHRHRDSLARIGGCIDVEEIRAAMSTVDQLRGTTPPREFEVIGSFLGIRNYSRYELEDAVGEGLAQRLSLLYRPHRNPHKGPSNYSLRIHVVGETAELGVRIGTGPLHRRGYKLASTPGSLHPPLAFAMAMLGGVSPGTVVLDPCCGSGTLPIEATRLEPMSIATGVDNNPEAISIAQENSARARSSSLFLLGDAGALPFADESVDVVLCNPPWARAVTPTGLLKDQPSSFWNELGRVLTSEGRAVLLTPQDLGVEEVVQRVGLRPQRSFSVALFGSWVSVTILGPHTRQRAISGDSRFRSEVERWILQSPTFPE